MNSWNSVVIAAAGAPLAVCLVSVTFSAGNPTALRAQTQPTAAPLAFEVASIKPNNSGEMRQGVRFYPPSDRVVVTNMTLRRLIQDSYQLQEYEVAGGPSWIDSDHFDIVASAEGSHSPPEKWLMMRALILERFKLEVHKESRELPVFALVTARADRKLGPNLKSVDPDCSPPKGPTVPPDINRPGQCGALFAGQGTINFRGVTMDTFTRMGLSSRVGRFVIDRTNLTGRFDLDLAFSPTARLQASPDAAGVPDAGDSSPSIFTALQEQLGLKLEAQKGPVDVLVIDRAEKPAGN